MTRLFRWTIDDREKKLEEADAVQQGVAPDDRPRPAARR